MFTAAWLFLRGISWQVYAGIALAAVLGFTHHWAYRKGEESTQAKWDKANVEAREAQDVADELARMNAHAAALRYEDTKAAQVIRYVTVTKEIDHAIEAAPAWAAVRLPDGMRSALAAAGQALAASQPDSAVPVLPAASGNERATQPGLRVGAGGLRGLFSPASSASGGN